MSANKNVHSVLLKNYPGLAHSRSFSQPLTSSRHSNGPNLAFESSMSPTSPSNENENGLSRSKSRRIRNEQAFLTWLKQDPRIQHTKDVQMIMVINDLFLPSIYSPQLCTSNDLFFHTESQSDCIFEGFANASSFANVSWCYVKYKSLSTQSILMSGHLSKFDDNHRKRENAMGSRF